MVFICQPYIFRLFSTSIAGQMPLKLVYKSNGSMHTEFERFLSCLLDYMLYSEYIEIKILRAPNYPVAAYIKFCHFDPWSHDAKRLILLDKFVIAFGKDAF